MIIDTYVLFWWAIVSIIFLIFIILSAKFCKTILPAVALTIIICPLVLVQISCSRLILVVKEYQILTEQKLTNFQQLKEHFNTKDGKYHDPLLIYGDFSSYVLQPEQQRIKFINQFKKPMFVFGDSTSYHIDTPWGINTFILKKYDTSIDDEIPICKMSREDISKLLISFYRYTNDNTENASKQTTNGLRFKISDLKFKNTESIHILAQNEDIDLRKLIEIISIKYAEINYPILELEYSWRGGNLVLPEKMKDKRR